MESFEREFLGGELGEKTEKDVVEFLNVLKDQSYIKDWQVRQAVHALKILFQKVLKASWAQVWRINKERFFSRERAAERASARGEETSSGRSGKWNGGNPASRRAGKKVPKCLQGMGMAIRFPFPPLFGRSTDT